MDVLFANSDLSAQRYVILTVIARYLEDYVYSRILRYLLRISLAAGEAIFFSSWVVSDKPTALRAFVAGSLRQQDREEGHNRVESPGLEIASD